MSRPNAVPAQQCEPCATTCAPDAPGARRSDPRRTFFAPLSPIATQPVYRPHHARTTRGVSPPQADLPEPCLAAPSHQRPIQPLATTPNAGKLQRYARAEPGLRHAHSRREGRRCTRRGSVSAKDTAELPCAAGERTRWPANFPAHRRARAPGGAQPVAGPSALELGR